VKSPGGYKISRRIRERQSKNAHERPSPPLLEELELDLLPEDEWLDEPDDLETDPLDLTDDPELLEGDE